MLNCQKPQMAILVIPKGNYTVQLSYENKEMDITVLIAIFTTIITSAATIYLFLDKSHKTISI